MCVEDHRVAKLVARSKAALKGSPFWPGSLHSFRAIFAQFVSFFELEEFGFAPYSIRRGGASFAFADGIGFDELLIKGRWQSNRTARLYLDTGRAALIQTKFSARQNRFLSEYVAQPHSFCEQLR